MGRVQLLRDKNILSMLWKFRLEKTLGFWLGLPTYGPHIISGLFYYLPTRRYSLT
jgi:hypothetical protein